MPLVLALTFLRIFRASGHIFRPFLPTVFSTGGTAVATGDSRVLTVTDLELH
jgi:hypothetical protein